MFDPPRQSSSGMFSPNSEDPIKRFFDQRGDGKKLEIPRHQIRGRKGGSFRRIRFMRHLERAAKRFGWHVEVGKIGKTSAGTEAQVKFTSGNAALELNKTAEDLKGIFEVGDVIVVPDLGNASRATLHLLERDLLLEREGTLWPGLQTQSHSLWEPIEFGWDQFGTPIRPVMMGQHSLFAGETRSGKTVAQTMAIATAALDPHAQIYILDPNEMLWSWEDVAERYVVSNTKDAAELLEFVLSEHERRNKIRKKAGLDKFSRELTEETGEGPIFLAIDEAPKFLQGKAKPCPDLIGEIAARSAVSGIHVSLTIQSPNATIIDTTLRNNFGLRGVFRVADQTASRVALGTNAVDASTIDRAHRGVCYLHQDGLLPTRMRTFYLTPDHTRELALRASSP